MLIYVNGQYVESSEARISPYDHGYLYGLGVFETFRIYNGHPFLLDDHYDRLIDALDTLQIKWTKTKDEVMLILKNLIVKNKLEHAYVRFNVSAGIDEMDCKQKCMKSRLLLFYKTFSGPGRCSGKRRGYLKSSEKYPRGCISLEVSPLFK